MTKLPRLSVVIPSAGRVDLLRLCLTSVVRHAPANTEITVIDDGSPGGVAGRTAVEFSGVQVIRHSKRRGFCTAANAGLAAANAPVVELLNDDCEVTPGWAEAALAAFDDPIVGAVAPLVLRGPPKSNPPQIDSAGDGYDIGGFARKRGHGQWLAARHLSPGRVFGASGSSAFYRRNLILRLGAFPPEFGGYFEDVDLAFRLHRAGSSVFYEPRSRVWHRGGSSYGRTNRRLVEQQSRNEERVFWRNLPPALLLKSLPRHLAVLAGKGLRRWEDGMLLPWMIGRLAVLGDIPALLRHRRELARNGPTGPIGDWHLGEF